MTEDTDEHNPSEWLLLRDARALVAEHTKSMSAAETLLIFNLADGRIRWLYWQCRGEWQPFLDPIVGRHWTFWRANPPNHLTIDWDGSGATRTGPPSIITARQDDSEPDGVRTISAEHLKILRAMLLNGELPATNYTVDLIRLHRGDVTDMLRSVGLAVAAGPVSAPAPAVLTTKISAKQWLAKADDPKGHPQRPDEKPSAYAQRLAGLMATDPAVKQKWLWPTLLRRLYEQRKDCAESVRKPRGKPAKP